MLVKEVEMQHVSCLTSAHQYAVLCAEFRERILKQALKQWVSEEEPALAEQYIEELGVKILGLTAKGRNEVSVAYPALLIVKVKGAGRA